MTEGQWLYMVANMSIDNDEEYEGMCDKCKLRAETKRCSGCGSEVLDNAIENNPNFDEEKFSNYKKFRA